MTDTVEHPTFDPAYVPMEGKQDSILVHCVDEDTMEFVYSAWDEVPRWFSIYAPDGSLVTSQEFSYQEGFQLPHVPGYRVVYHVGEEYNYNIIPGQCNPQTTTTTPSTTTTTQPPPTTTTPPTTEPETSSTTTPSTTIPEETTTTVESIPSFTTEATVQGTSTSSQNGVCERSESSNSGWVNSFTKQWMARDECEPTGASLQQTARTEFPNTGAVGMDPIQAVMLAMALILIGVLTSLPALVNHSRGGLRSE